MEPVCVECGAPVNPTGAFWTRKGAHHQGCAPPPVGGRGMSEDAKNAWLVMACILALLLLAGMPVPWQ